MKMRKDFQNTKRWISPILFIVLFLLSSHSAFGQFKIRGKVTDSEYNPLVGATIFLPDHDRGTVSERGGRFTIDSPADSVSVEISYLGYETQYLYLRRRSTRSLVIAMKEDVGLISEEVLIKDERFISKMAFEKIKPNQASLDLTQNHATYLNQLAGVQMQSGAYNTQKVMIRGIGTRSRFGTSSIRAYIDDIPLTDGVGESTIEQVDLASVAEVAVYKGPSSSKYGAALGGVIHYRTYDKYPTDETVDYRVTLGGDNYVRHQARLKLTNKAENISFGVHYTNTSADGWRDNSEFSNEFGSIYASYNYARGRTSIIGQIIDLNAQIPSSLNFDDFKNSPSSAAPSWAAVQGYEDNIRYRVGISNYLKLTDKIDLVTSIYGSQYDNFEVRPFNTLIEASESRGGRGYFSYVEDKVEHLLGMEVYNENYDWFLYVSEEDARRGFDFDNNTSNRKYFNYFLEGKAILTPRWNLEYGFNSNVSSYTILDQTTSRREFRKRYPVVFSPRLSISNSTPRTNYFLSFSHGFATPTVQEALRPNGLFDPSIGQERAWNMELGFRTQQNGLQINASVYHMWINDLLTPVIENDIEFLKNTGDSRHIGSDVSLDYAWPTKRGWMSQSTINLSYGSYRFRNFRDLNNDFSGNVLPGISPVQISTNHTVAFNDFTFNYNGVFNDSKFLNDANTEEVTGFMVHNISLNKTISLVSSLRAKIGLNVQNIFGTRYASMVVINAPGGDSARSYYPGQPRRVFASVQVQF